MSSISPLAASNEGADRLQAKLVASWQRAAPHHLAWVDTAVPGNRLQEHGAQLTLVRAHSSTFAPSQVGAAAYIYGQALEFLQQQQQQEVSGTRSRV
jgi:hypothetical protein